LVVHESYTVEVLMYKYQTHYSVNLLKVKEERAWYKVEAEIINVTTNAKF